MLLMTDWPAVYTPIDMVHGDPRMLSHRQMIQIQIGHSQY